MAIAMQEDVDKYPMTPNWSSIVEYYWYKRFISNKEAAIDRYRRAVMNDTKHKINCINCKTVYSVAAANKCWLCYKYTCSKCAEKALRKKYPKMIAPPSCVKCVSKCARCAQPFIAVTTEIHCFECQYTTGMFTIDWEYHRHPHLPYGTYALKKVYKKYIKHLKSSPDDNTNIIGNSIAIGTSAIVIGGNSIAIGYSANSY
jgi:hypothetical protein